jgi:hypothetical protein
MMRAFECNIKGREWSTTVYGETRGQAKYRYLLHVRDAWPDISFKDLTCHALKPSEAFRSSPGFLEVARRRGVPFARVGMKVTVEGHPGVIVGHNDSSNFDVYFTGGPHSGTVGNCHPGWKFEFSPMSVGGAS